MNHLERMERRMKAREERRLVKMARIIEVAESYERVFLGTVRVEKHEGLTREFKIKEREECARRLGIPLNTYLQRGL